MDVEDKQPAGYCEAHEVVHTSRPQERRREDQYPALRRAFAGPTPSAVDQFEFELDLAIGGLEAILARSS